MRRDTEREYRQMLKSVGLCTRCKGEARPARRECEGCAGRRADADRRRRAARALQRARASAGDPTTGRLPSTGFGSPAPCDCDRDHAIAIAFLTVVASPPAAALKILPPIRIGRSAAAESLELELAAGCA
jgi:hypothetical protein